MAGRRSTRAGRAALVLILLVLGDDGTSQRETGSPARDYAAARAVSPEPAPEPQSDPAGDTVIYAATPASKRGAVHRSPEPDAIGEEPGRSVSAGGLLIAADRSASQVAGDAVPARSGSPHHFALVAPRQPQFLPPSDEAQETVGAATPYHDQLIDPSQPVDEVPPTGPVAATSPGPPGNASTEYRFFDQTVDFNGNRRRYTEHGIAVSAQQETQGFGRLELRGALTDARASDGGNGFDGDGFLNVAQRDFALDDRWVVNNEIGHIRAFSPVEVASGYRIRLPTPLIEGAVVEASSQDLSLRLTSGSLGLYRGRTFPVFSRDGVSGRLAGAAGSYRIDPHWRAGVQLWRADGVTTSSGQEDFSTWAAGLRFDGRDAGKAQVNVLHNDHGANGVWADGERRLGAWVHNAGLFRLDPELEWVDIHSAIPNGVEGAYWRATTRSFHNAVSTGLDFARTNFDDAASIPRRSSAAGFAAVNHRASADTDFTGLLTLASDRTDNAGVQWESSTWSARGTVAYRFEAGRSIWALAASDRSGESGYLRYDASWDHYWNPGAVLSDLRTGVAFASQSGSNNDFSQSTIRMSANWARQRWSIGSHLSAGYYQGDDADHGSTIAAGLSARAAIARGWAMTADFSYNRNALTLLADGTETRVTDRQFLLSLRHDLRWGTPTYPVGFATGKPGHGMVRGVLFLDHNDNGLRDPEEPGVPGVVVKLDRGYSTETDAAGGFGFSPVANGDHHVSVEIANVPLPWVPASDRPVAVHVVPRRTSVVEIPLRKDLP